MELENPNTVKYSKNKEFKKSQFESGNISLIGILVEDIFNLKWFWVELSIIYLTIREKKKHIYTALCTYTI